MRSKDKRTENTLTDTVAWQQRNSVSCVFCVFFSVLWVNSWSKKHQSVSFFEQLISIFYFIDWTIKKHGFVEYNWLRQHEWYSQKCAKTNKQCISEKNELKWNSLSVLNTNIIDTTGILNILSGQAFRILQLMLQTSLELFVNQLQAS